MKLMKEQFIRAILFLEAGAFFGISLVWLAMYLYGDRFISIETIFRSSVFFGASWIFFALIYRIGRPREWWY